MKKRRNNNKYFLVGGIIALIIIIILAINVLDNKIKEDNLYNIGNPEEQAKYIDLNSVLVFDEYVLENFSDVDISLDTNKLYRSQSVIQGSTFSEAYAEAEKLKEIADKTEFTSSNLDKTSFNLLKKDIFENNYNKLKLSYFSNPNMDKELYDKGKAYLESYLNNKAIKTVGSGYLLNYYDGYESLLSTDINDINWDFLKDSEVNNSEKIKGLKYINNENYYIYSYLEDINLLDKSKLKDSKLKIDDLEVQGSFESITNIDDGFIIKFKLIDEIEKLYDKRFVNVQMETSNKELYKIPKKALVYMGDYTGLYYVSNRKVYFAPVKVFDEDDEFLYVSSNFNDIFPRKLNNEDLQFNKLESFSKVILNPQDYKEGDYY
ncbi:HlyD family efflux transporter periplasmic adaptor subunit [uncultured Helcococcus sp.]|uniref:HlyD family efflux transporter periplasmic adaptor subunit n=1 Tax=uncultured Helcococcus sp. TaxID=1072508 RepID=UPI00288C3EE9|nr:HlyD family efflux transporter periplasmic adaptor subunit [uncultured Helcococcus sp.]